MATYKILPTAYHYTGGWGEVTVGDNPDASTYVSKQSNENYRTIVGIEVTPSANEKVTSLSLSVGIISYDGNEATNKLGGYLYTNLNTAKSSQSGPPTGYIASATESGSAANLDNGKYCTVTWTGLNITSKTTLYAWLYTTGTSGLYEMWLFESETREHMKAPTATGVAIILGLVYIDSGSKLEAYQCFIDNGTKWEQYIPYIDNGTKWEQYS